MSPLPLRIKAVGLFLFIFLLTLGLSAAETAKSIPLSQLGAEASKCYQGDGLSLTPSSSGAELRCDFQNLYGSVTSDGLWLKSSASDAAKASFRVTARTFGRGTLEQLASTGQVETEAGIARYVRSGLVEEYSVSADGIRQDFIIATKPPGSGPLRLELSLTGAKAEASSEGATLILNDSGRHLSYHRLKVIDAIGIQLEAHMYVDQNNDLVVIVEDENAYYPVRVDPTFSDSDWVGLGGIIPGVDSGVKAIVRYGTDIYVAGFFSIAGDIIANRIAKWNGTSWNSLGTGMNGTIYALAVDSNGFVFAGGSFGTAGGVVATNIAKWNGSSWSSLGSGVNSIVQTLAIDGAGNLYAGGFFSSAGGIPAKYIAKWNGTTWSPLGSGMDSSVDALAVDSSGNLFAGGGFLRAGGVTVNNIAKWNGTRWSPLGAGLNGSVHSLVADNSGNLYAGGFFRKAWGGNLDYVAKWNGTAWVPLGSGLSGDVRSLAIDPSGNLWAGGDFFAPNYLAKWNGTSWSSGATSVQKPVNSLVFDENGNLYAGGEFIISNGLVAKYIAKWNGLKWSTLGQNDTLDGDNGYTSSVEAVTVDKNGSLYAARGYNAASGLTVSRITKWDGKNWSILRTGPAIRALATDKNGYLYAVGVSGIIVWNGISWASIGSGPSNLSSVVIDKFGNVYVGGSFSNGAGVGAQNIAKWDGISWSSLGSGTNGVVSALALDSNNNLYVGGSFTSAGGIAANNVAKWNGIAWSNLGLGVESLASSSTGSLVKALAVDTNNNLFVGGSFTKAGGVTREYMAKWNGSSWSAVGTGLFRYDVSALSADQAGNIYAGGFVSFAGGVSVKYLAKWNGLRWSGMGSGLNQLVSSLAVDNYGNLYVGGSFTIAGGKLSTYVAQAIINRAPNNILFSSTTIAEGNVTGSTVATLGATDVDIGDSHTFSLVSGAGSTDNNHFSVVGNLLKLNTTANFERKSSYFIRLRVTDAGGLIYENAHTIFITDIVEPPADTWRDIYFGDSANSGNGADHADPDGDGITNLMEFAFGTNPTSNGSGSVALQYKGTFAGGGTITSTGQPITLTENTAVGADFRAVFSRRKDHVLAGLTYTPQFSADLTTWENSAATPVVLADDGVFQIVSVKFVRAMSDGQRARFFRISISR